MIMAKSHILTQLIATLTACMTSLCGGYHTGWTSPSLVKLQADDSDLPVTSSQGAWIASIFNLACAFGSIIAGVMVNKLGRRLTLLSTALPYAVACILIGTAQNYWWLIIARFVGGIALGASITILPMYLGEISGDQIRGALGVFMNLIANAGLLLAYSVGPWVSRVDFAGVGLALPIIFALFFFWMPESPYFLVMKNKMESAEKSLTWLRGTSDVKEELKTIEANIRMEKSGTFKEFIMTKSNHKVLVIPTVLILAQQFNGILAILSYASLTFTASGSTLSSSISGIIIGVVSFLSGIVSIFTVDSIGRRPLIMLSFGGTIVSLVAEALYFNLQANGNDVSSISWLPVTAIVGYVVFYAIGLGCLPFVILSEILPCNMKAMVMTFAIIMGSISGTVVTKLYQVIADAYGIHTAFYAFAACSVVMASITYFVLPETKRRSFREIQDELHNSTDSRIAISSSHKF